MAQNNENALAALVAEIYGENKHNDDDENKNSGRYR